MIMEGNKRLCMLGISLLVLHLATAEDCPTGCECGSGTVKCTGISEFPEVPSGTTELDLENCNFPTIVTVPPYEGLKHLYVVNSEVRSINANAFGALKELEVLRLDENHLTDLTPYMFSGLGNLTELDLRHNTIKTFPDGLLSTLPTLKELLLNHNSDIKFADSSFEGSYVEELSLENCNLMEVPSAILREDSPLTALYLNNNKFEKLKAGSFDELDNLLTLTLGNCGLQEVDDEAFDDLKHLRELDLSENQLTTFDEECVDDIDSLLQINLQHNNLKKLDEEFKKFELSLEGNPWNCDCYIGWMKDITFQDNVTCITPDDVRGQSVKNVTSNLECLCGWNIICEEKSKLALYIAIPILIICVLLIAFFVYKIVRNRKNRAQRKSVKYSSVYKDTVESTTKQQMV